MKKTIIIILIALAFTVCDTGENNTSNPVVNPGDTPDNPIARIENRQLTTANWATLLNEIEADGKYVDLDLSACTRGNQTSGGGLWNDGSFNPDPSLPTIEKGKSKIVSLILPEDATSIPDGTYYPPTDLGGERYGINFRFFSNLKSIKGTNITTIGRNAFNNLGTHSTGAGQGVLANIDFPNVTKISGDAFNGCYSLISANIPKVETIEMQAFIHTRLQSLYIPDVTYIGVQVFGQNIPSEITLGKIAPWIDYLNSRVGTAARTVTVRVPQGATGYGEIPNIYIGGDRTKNWGNSFRGMGWNPSKANAFMGDGTARYDAEGYGDTSYINTNLTLLIEYTP